jgi:hypothetical protein
MLRAAILILTIAAGAAILSCRPIYEPDLWWHLAQGRETVSGHLVRTNVFSFTYPDYRQRFTPWLFDAAAYLAWTAVGGTGIQALQMLLLSLTLFLLYRACRARAPAWSAASILVIGVFLLEPRALPRPHVVSFAGMAACALLIERATLARSAAPLLWTIPLIALWSNLHVESVFGVVFIGVFAVGTFVRPSALTRPAAIHAVLVALGCGLATLANPYGWGLIAYLYENLSVLQMVSIAELQPPYLPDYRAFFFYLVLTGVLLLIQPRSLRLWEVLVVLTFGTLGVMHLRLTPLVLLATAPMVAERLAALATWGLDRRAILITACCAGLALSRIPLRLLATGFAVGTAAVEPPQFFSRDAVAFVKRHGLEGPVFNSHNLGGYVAWMLYPETRVFQDSRLQAYPPGHFRAVILAARSQAEWNTLVAGVDWAMLSIPRPNQLSGAGRFPASEWGTAFKDEAIEILVRRSGTYARVLGSGGSK